MPTEIESAELPMAVMTAWVTASARRALSASERPAYILTVTWGMGQASPNARAPALTTPASRPGAVWYFQ